MDVHAEMGDEEEEEQVPIPEIVITPEEMEQIGDPEVLLTNPFQLENLLEEHDALSLFKHQHCISLTLNILANRDVSKVPRWSSGAKDPLRHLQTHRHCGMANIEELRESRRSWEQSLKHQVLLAGTPYTIL